ncbi:MAG: hypothetical protein EA392_01450 [Cryomorphaceae bacterium]|nr:MAG: hypothetical protein EA392_01450 [Cryomorphaceae bacterium]
MNQFFWIAGLVILMHHAQAQETPDTLETTPEVPESVAEPDSIPPGFEQEIFYTEPGVKSDRVIRGDPAKKPERIHSPRKATIYSAVLPGLGQAYNRQYWKVPIVYAGVGVAVYFLQDNIKQANFYRQSYLNATDGDPSTVNTSGYSPPQLRELVIQHQKWRDYSYLGLVAVYLLNIVDAQVYGHLFTFDVSDELSLRIAPSVLPTAQPMAGLTFCLKL